MKCCSCAYIIAMIPLLLCTTPSSAAVRVAMVGSELSESGEVALGLAEAELSGRADLELLDRSAISQVLREQHLAEEGFARPDDAVRLGQLLAIDVFIHAEAIPGEEALGVAAFETVQGIRLLDRTVAGAEPDALARALAAAADAALAKWRAPAGQATAIALMGVRNVDLPKSRTGECEALGVLLERTLLDSPDVVVAERKRLQSLNLDREVAPNRPEARLLTAPVLVELDVEQAGAGGGLRAAAHLSNAKGGMLGIVRAGAKTAPELADKIGAKILEKLAAGTSVSAASPQVESARFFRQARFWKAQERPELALASAEAAYALDSANPVMRMLLINALFASANANLKSARPQALAYAARGMALLRQPSPPPTFSGPEQKKQFTQIAADVGLFFRGFGEHVGQTRGESPFSTEEAAIYAEFCRDWLAQSPYAPDAKQAVTTWDMLLFVAEPDAFEYFPDSRSAWQALAGVVERWCVERLGKERSAISPWTPLARLVAIEDGLGIPPDYRVRADLWVFFDKHGDPLLGWFGRCGRVFDDARQSLDPERLATPESRALLADLAAAIRAPAPEIPPDALGEIAWLAIRRNGGDMGPIDDRACRLIGQQLPELADWILVQLATGIVHDHGLHTMKSLLDSAGRAGMNEVRDEALRRLEAGAAQALAAPALSGPQRQGLIDFHDWLREQIEPGSTALQPAKGVRLKRIDLIQPEGYFYGHAALLGDGTDGIYAISASRVNSTKLMLQKWTPGAGKAVEIGVAETAGPHCRETSAWGVVGVVDACLGPGAAAVAVADEGVFLFDLGAPAVEPLHQTSMLPLTHPLSVGFLGQTLYVGTDDGYLAAYDLATRTGRVLVASSRKEKRSPFDDGPPVHVSAIFPDPARNRIVFLASVVEAESDLGMAVSRQSGIWEYLPETGTFRQRVSWRHRSDELRWSERDTGDTIVLGDMWGLVLRFDLSTDALDLLSRGDGRNKMNVFTQELVPAIEANSEGPIAVPIADRCAKVSPPYMTRGDWLWTAQPWGRLSMKTYQWEALPPLRMPDGTAQTILPGLGMVPIGDHRVLLAERGQLWLMTEENASQEIQ